MPKFLDLFLSELSIKRELIKSFFSNNQAIKSIYMECFLKHWLRIPELIDSNFEIFAVDSSDAIIEHKSGGILLISRALGLSNSDKELRELRVEILSRAYGDKLIAEVRSLLREHLEHIVALRAIDEFSDNFDTKVILLDGSLFGRMMQVPKGFDLPYFDDFILDYVFTYFSLLEKAKQNNVILIGVSKDSSAKVFRNMLLEEIFLDIINKHINDTDLREDMIKLWNSLPKFKTSVLEQFSKLMREVSFPEEVKNVLSELIIERTDFQVLMNCVESSGVTQPIELCYPAPTLDPLLMAIDHGNIEKYIKNSFRRSLIYKSKEDFLNNAKLILEMIPRYPAIISFYLVPDIKDIPIRVDVPANYFGLNDRIGDGKKNCFVFVDEKKFNFIISILLKFYSGPKHYNVLLEKVDKDVKFKFKNSNIYERV